MSQAESSGSPSPLAWGGIGAETGVTEHFLLPARAPGLLRRLDSGYRWGNPVRPRLRRPGGGPLAPSPVCAPPPPQPARPLSRIPAPRLRPALARRRPWLNPFPAGPTAQNKMQESEG